MSHALPRRRSVLLTAVLGATLALLLIAYAAVAVGSAHAAEVPLSQGKTATASSTENPGPFPASAAVDGNTGTRWSSAFSDPQWLRVDLGATATICQVVLNWEAAYARAFQIQLVGQRQHLDDHLLHHDRHRRHADPQRHRHRPLRAHVRHRRAHPVRLLALGVRRSRTAGTRPRRPPRHRPRRPPATSGATPAASRPRRTCSTVKVLNRTNGQYPDSQVYWSFNGQTHSIAEQPYLDMPANSAGRMYFYLGSPNSQYFDFIEFTVGPDVFNGNTTRVDAFGLKLALRLHAHDGNDVQVGEDQATFAEDRSATFQKFPNEVPTEFKHLATATAPYRILAPGSDPAFRPAGSTPNYCHRVRLVGRRQRSDQRHLRLRRVAGEPTAACAPRSTGTPRTCRSRSGQTPANFYQAAPANYYAKFWHDHAINKLAYGFPYDDVAGQSSFISHGDPQWLLVAVGW